MQAMDKNQPLVRLPESTKKVKKKLDKPGSRCYNKDRKEREVIEMLERRTREEMLTEVIRMFGHEAPETIDEAQIGGLGIFFAKEMADELYYHYTNGENHLKIIKKV